MTAVVISMHLLFIEGGYALMSLSYWATPLSWTEWQNILQHWLPLVEETAKTGIEQLIICIN